MSDGEVRRAKDIRYVAGPTAAAFHADHASKVKALMSGVGQGKSSACAVELGVIACQQKPDDDGVRRTRMAVIRATYAQLTTTTINTVLDWFPEQKMGKKNAGRGVMRIVYGSPIKGFLSMPLADGTRVESTWYFMPIENSGQLSNLLSLELTAAWINEASEIQLPSLIADVYERCRRFPHDWTRCQVLMDYNPPPVGSWLYEHFEMLRPDGHVLWKYPSPVIIQRDPSDPDNAKKYKFIPNPDGQLDGPAFKKEGVAYWLDSAENRRFDENKLVRFIAGQYPLAQEGRPVHPMFNMRRHVVDRLTPTRSNVMVIGMDCGLTPACVFGQVIANRLCIFDEIKTTDKTALALIREDIVPIIKNKYLGFRIVVCVDPASTQRSQVDAATVFGALFKAGLNPTIPPTNSLTPRIEALDSFLAREGGFAVDAECKNTVTALSGGFRWKDSPNNPREKTTTDKQSEFSHIGDAIQYLACYFTMDVVHGLDYKEPDIFESFAGRKVIEYEYPSADTFMYV